MATSSLVDPTEKIPSPQGHVIGFVDSQSNCDALVQELSTAGFPRSVVAVLNGPEGEQFLTKMFAASSWGEASEQMMKQSEIELSHGHLGLMIEANDHDQAVIAANIAKKHGGHGFQYFGELVDEKLTL
jgi:hypothetical protein